MQPPVRPDMHPQEPRPKRRKRRGRFRRFVRGYLMFVGTMTTLYVLLQLFVLLFVEIGRWMPTQPNF